MVKTQLKVMSDKGYIYITERRPNFFSESRQRAWHTVAVWFNWRSRNCKNATGKTYAMVKTHLIVLSDKGNVYIAERRTNLFSETRRRGCNTVAVRFKWLTLRWSRRLFSGEA